MCSSPFYSVLFFDAEHKQLAENVIQSHDDELYRKLRDPDVYKRQVDGIVECNRNRLSGSNLLQGDKHALLAADFLNLQDVYKRQAGTWVRRCGS